MAPSVPVILLAVPFLVAAACGRNEDFRHAAHLTVTKGACAPCHGSDPASPRRATDADCAACHKQGAASAGAGRYRVGKDAPASASRSLYAGESFAHAPHAAAGIPCAECHAASKWRGNRFVPPTAEECSACHAGTAQRGAGQSEGPRGGAAAPGPISRKILI